jgi:hypothetical protein
LRHLKSRGLRRISLKPNVRDVALARVAMIVGSGRVARSVLIGGLVGRLRLPTVRGLVLKQ